MFLVFLSIYLMKFLFSLNNWDRNIATMILWRSALFLHADTLMLKCRSSSIKKVLLEISQNSQENTSSRDSFLIKRHRCFPVNFAKYLWVSFLKIHLRWLLLSTGVLQKNENVTNCLRKRNKKMLLIKFNAVIINNVLLDARGWLNDQF